MLIIVSIYENFEDDNVIVVLDIKVSKIVLILGYNILIGQFLFLAKKLKYLLQWIIFFLITSGTGSAILTGEYIINPNVTIVINIIFE